MHAADGPVGTKLVQVVDKDSSSAAPRFAEGGGATRDQAKRGILRDVAEELLRMLQDHFGRASMQSALQAVRDALGEARYASLLREARAGSLADGARLFPGRL